MSDPGLPIVLVPGLNCSARLYAEQIPALWRFGPVFVADHTRDDTISAIARRILAAAPPRFALAGLSMGGYISFEIMRQAAERVAKLALLDTGARAESRSRPERRPRIELAESRPLGRSRRFALSIFVHPNRHNDEALKATHAHDGRGGRRGSLPAPAAGHHGAGRIRARALSAITCPTLVLVGDGDAATPPALVAGNSRSDSGRALVVVPDCGHLSTLERPERVTRPCDGGIVDRMNW